MKKYRLRLYSIPDNWVNLGSRVRSPGMRMGLILVCSKKGFFFAPRFHFHRPENDFDFKLDCSAYTSVRIFQAGKFLPSVLKICGWRCHHAPNNYAASSANCHHIRQCIRKGLGRNWYKQSCLTSHKCQYFRGDSISNKTFILYKLALTLDS